MELGVGHVRLHAKHRDDTVVVVVPSDAKNEADVKAAEQTVVEYGNQRLLVKAPKQRGLFGRIGSIDITIDLPHDSELSATAREASFYSTGRLLSCRIKTSTGDAQFEEAGSLVVTTGVGDISMDRADGPTEVTTGSGAVRIRELVGTAVLKSSNGSIVVDRACQSLEAKAANGDIRIGEIVRGSIVLGTSIGQLEIGIGPDTSARLDIRSVSGSIHNFMTPTDGPEPSDETAEVFASTTVGDVTIRRSTRPRG
ncbi:MULTISPECIES: DUF4097 family beta strand repeat-containing protein [unclassified Streptomyces]|uniref:DUF4097 family beta strand repeat-containing protein n=1 Tax=unclassified Streptomyces TaxID=2593676 RepID=UPI003450BDB1